MPHCDCGDIDSFNRLSKTYDALRKSSNFNAASQKEKEGLDAIDSVGELVAYCEKQGGKIPEYEITADKDIIDTIIRDLKEYTKSLIYFSKI